MASGKISFKNNLNKRKWRGIWKKKKQSGKKFHPSPLFKFCYPWRGNKMKKEWKKNSSGKSNERKIRQRSSKLPPFSKRFQPRPHVWKRKVLLKKQKRGKARLDRFEGLGPLVFFFIPHRNEWEKPGFIQKS